MALIEARVSWIAKDIPNPVESKDIPNPVESAANSGDEIAVGIISKVNCPPTEETIRSDVKEDKDSDDGLIVSATDCRDSYWL